MDAISYSYKPRAFTMAWAALFFGACAAFGFFLARTDTRDILIDGLLVLRGHDAVVFRWAIAIVSAMMCLGGVWGVVRAMTSRQTLTLDSTGLGMPKSAFSDALVTIPYATVTGLQHIQVKSQRFLTVRHAKGKVSIARSMLPDTHAYDRVCDVLAERVGAARGSAPL